MYATDLSKGSKVVIITLLGFILLLQGCATQTSVLQQVPIKKSPAKKPVKPAYRAQPQYLNTQGPLRSKSDLVREGMTKDKIRQLFGSPDKVENIWSNKTTWFFNGAKCLVSWGTTGFTYQTTSQGRCTVQFSKETEVVNGWDFNGVRGSSMGTYCVANCPAGVPTVQLPIRSSNGYTFN